MDELVNALRMAPIQPKPLVKVLYFISDWKKYVEPKLTKEKLANHSGYHCFKITDDDSKVCLRGKVLSTDKEWYPKSGIKLLVDNPNLSEKVEASEFRFEQLRMQSVMHDVQSKYLPLLHHKKRQETEASWKALERTYQKLEVERKFLKALSLADLPKYRPPPPPDTSCVVTKLHGKTTSMWGTFYPDSVIEGNIQCDAKLGLDCIVYNEKDKSSRPWVGVIKEISEDKQTFTLQWYKRAPGGGKRFKEDLRGGGPYLTDVNVASVMLYSVADHLQNGDLDLSDGFDRIMETYVEHDDCYP